MAAAGKDKRLVAIAIDRSTILLKVPAALVGKRREISHLRVQVAVEMFKAALIGMVSLQCVTKMPFTYHCGLVTRCLESLGHEMLLRMNTYIHPGHDHAVGNAQAHWVPPGHQRRPGGRTDRRGIKPGQFYTFCGQTVQRWRIDIAAVESDVRPTQIICQHNDDVGALVRQGGWYTHQHQQHYQTFRSHSLPPVLAITLRSITFDAYSSFVLLYLEARLKMPPLSSTVQAHSPIDPGERSG